MGTLSFKGRFWLRAVRKENRAQRSHSLREISPPFAANLLIGDAMDGLVTPAALDPPIALNARYSAGERARRQDNLFFLRGEIKSVNTNFTSNALAST